MSQGPDADIQRKRGRLLEILRGFGSAAVALSGGVDSSVLARAAAESLGSRAVAFTSISPSLPPRDRRLCRELAEGIGIELVLIETRELDDARYCANASDRCYWCKSELFEQIAGHPRSRDLAVICDGANTDDASDYRPGLAAAGDRGVRHPLQEADLDKEEVRRLARLWDLPNAEKPAAACLASRIAYGEEVTAEKLQRVATAEAFLTDEGFTPLRVRYHAGDVARIEIAAEQLPHLLKPERRDAVIRQLKRIGFKFVSVDLEGFRSGSMNRVLNIEPGPPSEDTQP